MLQKRLNENKGKFKLFTRSLPIFAVCTSAGLRLVIFLKQIKSVHFWYFVTTSIVLKTCIEYLLLHALQISTATKKCQECTKKEKWQEFATTILPPTTQNSNSTSSTTKLNRTSLYQYLVI